MYRIDLHPSTGGDNYIDVAVAARSRSRSARCSRSGCATCSPAGKNIGTTHITNGCYRLHPVEWNVGEAAGALAAHCLTTRSTPAQVHGRRRAARWRSRPSWSPTGSSSPGPRSRGTDGTTGTARLLTGVTVPLVTPMEPGGRPSPSARRRSCDALHAAGVRTAHAARQQRRGPAGAGRPARRRSPRGRALGQLALLDRRHDRCPGQRHAPGTPEALERAEAAAAAGADALVLSPPIYFHHRDDEIVAHYAALADLGLPVVAYNAPRYSNPLTPGWPTRWPTWPHVVGIKDSSGDLELLAHLVGRRRPPAGLRGRPGRRDPARRRRCDRGAHGIVPGVANLAPVAARAGRRAPRRRRRHGRGGAGAADQADRHPHHPARSARR